MLFNCSEIMTMKWINFCVQNDKNGSKNWLKEEKVYCHLISLSDNWWKEKWKWPKIQIFYCCYSMETIFTILTWQPFFIQPFCGYLTLGVSRWWWCVTWWFWMIQDNCKFQHSTFTFTSFNVSIVFLISLSSCPKFWFQLFIWM